MMQHALEHEEDRRGGHVAVILEDAAPLDEGAVGQAERSLQGCQHLGAARVADEGVDIIEAEPASGEETLGDAAKLAAHEGGDVPRKEGLKSILLDRPAHDVERLRPSVFAACA